MSDEFKVFKFVRGLRLGVNDFDFRAYVIKVDTILFAVNVKPLSIEGKFHLGFCDFGRFIVVKRV